MRIFKNFGFTIVELMIVVVIIGILATIAIPNYIRSVEIAKCSQGMAILSNMRTAELDYFRENDIFTASITDLEDQVGASFINTKDWIFDDPAPVVTATTFTLTAKRAHGPHEDGMIELNEMGVWTDNGYPYETPGIF